MYASYVKHVVLADPHRQVKPLDNSLTGEFPTGRWVWVWVVAVNGSKLTLEAPLGERHHEDTGHQPLDHLLRTRVGVWLERSTGWLVQWSVSGRYELYYYDQGLTYLGRWSKSYTELVTYAKQLGLQRSRLNVVRWQNARPLV